MVNSPLPALIMQARRKVTDHLSSVGATSADSAVTYIPRGKTQKKALSDLAQRGVVSLAEGGRYWVDEEKAAQLQRTTKTRIAVIAGGALAAVAAVFAFTR